VLFALDKTRFITGWVEPGGTNQYGRLITEWWVPPGSTHPTCRQFFMILAIAGTKMAVII